MKDLFSCLDVANRYGVSLATVWRWIRSKRLPAMKIGKVYRVRSSDLDFFESKNKT